MFRVRGLGVSLVAILIGVSQNKWYFFKGPRNKDYSIWGSILGSPYFGKVPYAPEGQRLATLPIKFSTEVYADI